MRKGYIFYKDPRDNTFVRPKQGQFYLALDKDGLIEVRGDQGQSIVQTQFIGTGATIPGQYLPLAGGTVTGPVLFKGNVNATNPVVISNTLNVTGTISSGGTDLSVLFAGGSGPLATYTNGVNNRIITSTAADGINGEANLTFDGSALEVTGSFNATSTISSGGTDLSVLFAGRSGPLATYTNGVNNRIITSTAADGINGEANLTFDGSALEVTGSFNATSTISSGGTDLSVLFGGGSGPLATYTNGANNRVITSTAADGINGEANLTFDGSTLGVTGSITATVNITASAQLKGATYLSGITDMSTLFRGAGDTGGWTSTLDNFETLNEATENPYRIITSRLTTVVAGGMYYLSSSGAWAQTDASASGTSIGCLGIAETTSSKNPGMLTNGIVQINSTSFGGTAVTGGTIYVSETASQFTFDPPTTSGAVVRAIGHFIEDYSTGRNTYYNIYFNPSHDYFVVS